MLVHGAMDRSGGMLRVRRVLQSSCRVLRYDRRGYARSLPAGRRRPASTSRSTTWRACSTAGPRCWRATASGGLVSPGAGRAPARPGAGRRGLRGARDVGAVVAGLAPGNEARMALPRAPTRGRGRGVPAPHDRRRDVGAPAGRDAGRAPGRGPRPAGRDALRAPACPAAVHRGRRHRPGRGRVRQPRPARTTCGPPRTWPATRRGASCGSSRAPDHGAHLTHPNAFAGLVAVPSSAAARAPIACGDGATLRGAADGSDGPSAGGGVRRAGGLRPVGWGQPRRPPDRDDAGADRARHPSRPGRGVLGGGDQRRGAGRGPDDGRRRAMERLWRDARRQGADAAAACCRQPVALARRGEAITTTPGCGGRSRNG